MSRRKKPKYSYDPSRDPFELAIDRFRPSELPISPSKLEDLARLRQEAFDWFTYYESQVDLDILVDLA